MKKNINRIILLSLSGMATYEISTNFEVYLSEISIKYPDRPVLQYLILITLFGLLGYFSITFIHLCIRTLIDLLQFFIQKFRELSKNNEK